MVEKPNAPRGRPIKNKVERIPASAKAIARAIFQAAKTKNPKLAKPKKRKPN